MPPSAVVADANVLLSALIGGRARLVLASARGPRCFAAEAVAHEIADRLPRLAAKRHLDLGLHFAALQVMPVDWQPASAYEPFREEATGRMAGGEPDDWPAVAVALSLSLPVWSQDKDFEESGLQVYTTGDLLDAFRRVGRV